MKDDYYLPTTTTSIRKKEESSSIVYSRPFGKIRYKLWGLVAVLLLAFWSLFTGSVTLDFSTAHFSSAAIIHDDLDILEVEDREKVVRHMWEVYTHNSARSISRLPRFWEDAFEAAYDDLVSDVLRVRKAAVWEIAKLSMRSIVLPTESLINKSGQDALIITGTGQLTGTSASDPITVS